MSKSQVTSISIVCISRIILRIKCSPTSWCKVISTCKVGSCKTYINCIGQPQLPFEKFPFKGLLDGKSLCKATYKFQSRAEGEKEFSENPEDVIVINQDYHLKVSGLAINDYFQVLDKHGAYNPHLYMMAVPYISGYNPDYSGLDFCEAASERILEGLLSSFE